MNDSLISVKGNKNGLQLICSDQGTWDEVIAEIKSFLTGENRSFFKGASVIVDTSTRVLTAEQVAVLWKVLEGAGLTIKGLRTEAQEETSSPFPRLGKERGRNKAGTRGQTQGISETEYVNPKPVLIVKRNLRSGQKISFDGNVLIFGDVNPGAEVIASGFIMVFGYLRGIAHAGSTGDEKAWVMSFRLQPTQLRIANSITRPPDEEPQGPEIAKIQDSMIICEGIDLKKYYDITGGN